MIAHRPYAGPIECLTIEEWAVRFRVSADHFDRTYTGRRIHFGSNLRIYAADVHEWLDGRGGAAISVDAWDGVGDAPLQPGAVIYAKADEVRRRAPRRGKGP